MNQSTTISLFEEDLSCKACLHKWHGFVHGFSRGHSVLTNGKQFLFIPDDLVYDFPNDFDFTYEDIFLNRGWWQLERCPICKSERITPPKYDQTKIKNLPCIFIDKNDLKRINNKWLLTESGEIKIAIDPSV